MKQTKAYRTALAQLADALAQQNPAKVFFAMRGGNVVGDLFDVLRRRHRAFDKAMDRAWEEHQQRNKQRATEKRRATLAQRAAP
jgi:hypothetical protein